MKSFKPHGSGKMKRNNKILFEGKFKNGLCLETYDESCTRKETESWSSIKSYLENTSSENYVKSILCLYFIKFKS